MASSESISILRRKVVEARVGLSRSSLYAMVAAGKFPAPVALGPNSVGWRDDLVDKWISERQPARCAPKQAGRGE